jgi:hypothetical protein
MSRHAAPVNQCAAAHVESPMALRQQFMLDAQPAELGQRKPEASRSPLERRGRPRGVPGLLDRMVGFPAVSEATSPMTSNVPMKRNPAAGIIHAGSSSTC